MLLLCTSTSVLASATITVSTSSATAAVLLWADVAPAAVEATLLLPPTCGLMLLMLNVSFIAFWLARWLAAGACSAAHRRSHTLSM
jgi:hypothetical protein